MKTHTLGMIPICLCLFVLAPVTAQSVEDLQARVAQLEAQLAERDARIARLEAQLSVIQQRTEHLDEREAQLEVMAGAVTTGEYAERFESLVTQSSKEGRTVVSAGPLRFEDEPLVGDLFLSAVYSLPGDSAVGRPESVSVFIQGKFTGGQFRGTETLSFDLAGETLHLPVADYQTVSKRSGLLGKKASDKSDETLTLVVDVATLRRLAEATALSVSTPRGEVVWQREQRALLRALLARMEATDR